jgi:hypothetical protein
VPGEPAPEIVLIGAIDTWKHKGYREARREQERTRERRGMAKCRVANPQSLRGPVRCPEMPGLSQVTSVLSGYF